MRFPCFGKAPSLRAVFLGSALSISASGMALAQSTVPPSSAPDSGSTPAPATADIGSAILEYVPPALTQLSAQAVAKESFTLDRTMLAAATSLLPDSDADLKPVVAKLDGVSVHILRFAAEGVADPVQIQAIRDAYHLRGWKHVLHETNVGDTKTPGNGYNGLTDVWVVLDGANVRGAVVLVVSPKSVTLATVAGNLSPVDLLRLRGHFGIPRFEGDGLGSDAGKR